MERSKPCAGEFYRHFKGNLYQIIGCAIDAGNLEEIVVYQALYGEYKWYTRPLHEFMSTVDEDKYPAMKGKWRFEKVAMGNNGAALANDKNNVEEIKTEAIKTQVTETQAAEDKKTEKSENSVTEQVSMHEIYPEIVASPDSEEYVRPELLRFLDASTPSEKLLVLRDIRKNADAEILTTLELSLDLMPDDKEPLERRLELIELNLEKRVKYEGSRLR